MPRTDAPKMIEIKFSVPEQMLKDALEMAATEGVKPAELHRMAWENGLAVWAERSNKRLVNRKLRKEAKRSENDEGDE